MKNSVKVIAAVVVTAAVAVPGTAYAKSLPFA